MASDVPTSPLEEIAELTGGYAFKSSDYSDDGRFILRTLNIKDDGSIVKDDAVFLPLDKCSEYERFALQEHDTLFVMVGATLGKVGYVRKETLPALLNQNMWRIRGREGRCDKRYLQYAFRHVVSRNLGWASGSARDFVRRDDYRKLPIPTPPLPEQKAIARILGTLDDKIELNRRMNATLEAMARALFTSWFVDFDPVHAKAAGRQPAGMDAQTAALFPDSFQDSELGEIPNGWAVTTIEKLSAVGIGKTPPRKESQWFSMNATDVPWMSIRDLGSSGTFIAHTSEFLTPEAVDKFRIRRIPDNTVVLSFKLTLGRVAITDGEMLSNEAIAHFKLNAEANFDSAYLYCYLKSFDYGQMGSTSSIATAVNSEMVRQIKILVPSKDICAAFTTATAPIFDQMKNIQRQSRTLATLRDTLLPKLLSGEISIQHAIS